jgi:hypothetical protein
VIAKTEVPLLEFSVLVIWKIDQEFVIFVKFIVIVEDVWKDAHQNGMHVERLFDLQSFPYYKFGAIVLRMSLVKASLKSVRPIEIVIKFKLMSCQKLAL